MKELLAFLIENLTGSKDFEISEEDGGEGRVTFFVKANPDIIGLIIGKEGKTIKNIRKIVSVKATSEKKAVNISVS